MQTTKTIWQNGKFIPWDEAKVHVLTHALHYGGGAFEGIRFYKTKQGPAVFRLGDHIDRLFYSSKALGMELDYSKDEIIHITKELIRTNELDEGYLRPIVFYGYGKMGVNPIGSPIEFVIACWPWGAYLAHEEVNIKTSRYIRIHPDSTIVDAKITGHYVNGILASLDLKNTHYDEAFFLDSQGHVSEGVGENFFLVKSDKIYTPPKGTILNGITRSTIMELATKLNYEVIETCLSLPEVYRADEAFFTGTAAEVTTIGSVDDQIIGNGKIGPVTHQLKTAYHELVRGKNPAFLHYLTFVNE